jgi:hypothetical protein
MVQHIAIVGNEMRKAINAKNKSGKTLLRNITKCANKRVRGAGNSNAILKAAAINLVKHPKSKNAQKMVTAAVKRA